MKPDVKKYLNVCQYLHDIYQFRKTENRDFSYDVWAQELGVANKSYVRFLTLGRRPINEKMIQVFVANLRLADTDRSYFETLVHYSQSKSSESKALFGKKLMGYLKTDIDQLQVSAHYEFLANPLIPRLQVFLSFNDIEKTPQKLAWLLGCAEGEVIKGLEILRQISLVRQVGDQYVAVKSSYKVPDQFGDLGLNAFYNHSLESAKAAIDLPKEERRYKSLFLPLNPDEFQDFLNHMQTYVSEQLVKYNTDEYRNRRLYQVNLNVIPVGAKMPVAAPIEIAP